MKEGVADTAAKNALLKARRQVKLLSVHIVVNRFMLQGTNLIDMKTFTAVENVLRKEIKPAKQESAFAVARNFIFHNA